MPPAGDSIQESLEAPLSAKVDGKSGKSFAVTPITVTPRSTFLKAGVGSTELYTHTTGGGTTTSLPAKRNMPRRSELQEEKKKKMLELLDSLVTPAMDPVGSCGSGGGVDARNAQNTFEQSWGDSDVDDLDLDALEAAALAGKTIVNDRNSVHYKICAVEKPFHYETVLFLENPFTHSKVVAHLREPWNEQEYREGESVNLIGASFTTESYQGGYDTSDNNKSSIKQAPINERFAAAQRCWLGRIGSAMSPTLLVHFPDLLLGGTRIASSLNCTRRGYLSERVTREEGTEPSGAAGGFTAQARTRGNLYHALFQAAIANDDAIKCKQNLNTVKSWLTMHAKEIARRSYLELFDAGMTEAEAEAYLVDESLGSILSFLNQFVNDNGPARVQSDGSMVTTGVSEVLDIEEYIASPKYGLKGYIDASVRVNIQPPNLHHGYAMGMSLVAPLELKTGKERDSDIAQLLLYLLMMEDRYGGPCSWGVLVHKGLTSPQLVGRNPDHLVYLMAARNRLAAALDWGNTLTSANEPPPLTELAGACLRCYASKDCMLAHACGRDGTAEGFVNGRVPPGSSEYNQLVGMYNEVSGHLNAKEVEFMRLYVRLLDLEEASSKDLRHEAWSMDAEARQAVGRCLAGLTLSNCCTSVVPNCRVQTRQDSMRQLAWLYTFSKSQPALSNDIEFDDGLAAESFGAGDMVTLSIDGRHTAIARGHVVEVSSSSITVEVDKRIRPSLYEDKLWLTWRVDKEEIGSTIPRQRGFLFALFEKAHAKLRSLIIDLTAPHIGSKELLPHEVHTIISTEASLSKLNAQQVEAIYAAVVSRDYALVLGMPGTGKTTTVVSMIRVLAALGLKVLLTSYTNSAVDNVLLKLVNSGLGFKCVRVGRRGRVHPNLEPWMPSGSMHGADSVQGLKTLAETVSVVGVPALGVTDPLVRRIQFDVCIIDEAGQITVPASLGPLMRAPRFVLVGDPHQLPPLVTGKAAEEGGLSDPLFRRLAQAHPSAVFELSVQYRMADEIQVLPNLLTYQGKLTCGCSSVASGSLTLTNAGSLAHLTAALQQALAPENRVVFIDTPRDMVEMVRGNAVVNRGEAELVKRIVDGASSCGVDGNRIGIISPYKAQVSVIAKLLGQDLPDIECLTVDKAQGRDKDCVIVSLVRCNPDKNGGKLLADVRRLNVAITRARHKLILVGNSSTLCTIPLFATLFDECRKRGWVVTL